MYSDLDGQFFSPCGDSRERSNSRHSDQTTATSLSGGTATSGGTDGVGGTGRAASGANSTGAAGNVNANGADSDDSVVDDWEDPHVILARYKTKPCVRDLATCRKGYGCPYYHSGKDMRRSPLINVYRIGIGSSISYTYR